MDEVLLIFYYDVSENNIMRYTNTDRHFVFSLRKYLRIRGKTFHKGIVDKKIHHCNWQQINEIN